MLINLFSDIHGRLNWFDFIFDKSQSSDATIIAGDVLDGYDRSTDERTKVQQVLDLALKLENGNRVSCFTSGNHDLDDSEVFGCESLELEPGKPAFSALHWMRFPILNDFRYVHSYCDPFLVGNVLILALPWVPWTGMPQGLSNKVMDSVKLARFYADYMGIKLIFVHHEEPESSFFLESLVRTYRPDFFICGHKHLVSPEDGPVRDFYGSLVINCGQDLSCPEPWFGVLDTDRSCLEWHFTIEGKRQTSISSFESHFSRSSMKSHSYIPITSTRGLAQKINRSGVTRLHSEELEHLGKHLESIAASCQPKRAKEIFSFFNRSMPEGFECNPVPGENDAEMARIRARFDERRRR